MIYATGDARTHFEIMQELLEREKGKRDIWASNVAVGGNESWLHGWIWCVHGRGDLEWQDEMTFDGRDGKSWSQGLEEGFYGRVELSYVFMVEPCNSDNSFEL